MFSSVDKPSRTPDNVIPFPSHLLTDSPGQDNNDDVEIEIEGEPGEQPEDSPSGDQQDFDGNLAEHIEEDELSRLGQDLVTSIQEDIQSRSEWSKAYKDSLDYLGIKTEVRAHPFEGACNVVHPMMLEAIVRFQSRALVKLFPSSGPAAITHRKSQVDLNPQIQIEMEKAAAALNEYIMEEMPEMCMESDRLLFSLASIGYAAKKVFFHESLGRVTTQLVKAEDFLLPYGCDNLSTCPRFTEEVRRTQLEVKNLQASGYYLDMPLFVGSEDMGEVEEAKTEMIGQTPSITLQDGMRLYECYVDMHFDTDQYSEENAKPSPYVVTIDKDSQKVLSVRRNWRMDDNLRRKRVIFVPYVYVPGDGSYGYGLVHLIGQISSAATKIQRQLIDAGTFANVPALFASRDAKMTSQAPLKPGEIRKVDMDAEMLQKAFFPLPFKEPSQVLMALMTSVVADGKSFSSTSDLDISASSQNAPVGTTLALIERQTEVQNAVQSRMHISFGRELNLVVQTIKEFDQDTYGRMFGRLEKMIGPGNFTICPVADPTSATMSQRVIQLQGIAQMAAVAPQVYDMAALHRTIISAMGITDAGTLVPDRSQSQPMGLVEEQMAFLTGKPVQCYPFYDHKSHIQAHMNLLNDPLYQQVLGANPGAQQIVGAIHSDIAQHIAFNYHNEIEQQLGTQLPPLGRPQDPKIDAALSQLVAQASNKVSQQHTAQAQQMAAQQQASDPAYQLEKADLDIKRQKVQNEHSAKLREQDLKHAQHQDNAKLKVLQIESQQQSAQTAGEQKLASEILKDQQVQHGMAVDLGGRLLDHAEHLNQMDHSANQLQQQGDIAQQQAEAAAQKAQQQPNQ